LIDISSLESVGILKGDDVLDTALSRFQQAHPECAYHNHALEAQNEFDEQYQKEINFQIEQEKNLPPRQENNLQEPEIDPQSEYFPFETARLFMSQLGLLSFDYLKDGAVHMLSKSPAFIRDIKGLDKKFCRDVAKVAVIYVAPGQEDELSIFKNAQGSPQYEEFVRSLGWQVNLAYHPGYAGGLDSSMVKDGLAIYFCNSMSEIIFHDATKLENQEHDPKLLKKKRHIGNDHVHIIWNEHYRDYRFDTIGGDFGNAQIVVSPLPNGLYAIDTYKDETVASFGPLQCRSIISKECLGTLVRCTALNAYRAAHAVGNTYAFETHPFSIRKQTLEIISTRHKVVNDSYEKFMTSIFTEGVKATPSLLISEALVPAV
jgi:hypothetical protein